MQADAARRSRSRPKPGRVLLEFLRDDRVTDVFEHNPEDHDDPVAGTTWLIGLLGAILLVVTIMGVTALYYNAKGQKFNDQFVNVERLEVRKLRHEQEALLIGPSRWVERDEQGETVEALIIPIERAMELVVEEAKAGS